MKGKFAGKVIGGFRQVKVRRRGLKLLAEKLGLIKPKFTMVFSTKED